MHIPKLVQTVDYILSQFDGTMNYLKLIKLVYIADKQKLSLTGSTISGDDFFSMPQGPVPSKTLNLIKDYGSTEDIRTWNKHFRTLVDDHEIEAIGTEHEYGELSRREREIIDEVCEKYRNHTWQEMIDVVHDESEFPEVKWREAREKNTSFRIPMVQMMKAVDIPQEEIDAILDESDSEFEEEIALQWN